MESRSPRDCRGQGLVINNGQALKTAFRGLQFIQSDQCWGSWLPFEGILICWILPPCLQEHWRAKNWWNKQEKPNNPFFSPCPRLNVFFEMHSECYNLTRLSIFGSLGVLYHQFLCANGFPNVFGGFWGPKVLQKQTIVKKHHFQAKITTYIKH